MTENNAKKATSLIFVCSGAADVGELTDRAARQLTRQGLAAMSCVASVGARDDDIMFNAELAGRVLLIDGCPKSCTRRSFKHAGLNRFVHFDLSKLGLLKGGSPCTPDNIRKVIQEAAWMLGRQPAGDRAGEPARRHAVPPDLSQIKRRGARTAGKLQATG